MFTNLSIFYKDIAYIIIGSYSLTPIGCSRKKLKYYPIFPFKNGLEVKKLFKNIAKTLKCAIF
ncbi:MAG: hypothetical protein A2451_10800 [Bdellovibrionales bacterium RIFOXYC2_FULL_39_8]|nr:MAG: hypothetical protein A2451_10800 [Bdellovibrionales bacterium RIFOXYC2_FULL_39_8]